MATKTSSTLNKTIPPETENEDFPIGTQEQSTSNETLEMQFKTFCIQFGSWIVPDVNIVSQEPVPGIFPEIPSLTSNNEVEPAKVPQDLQKSLQNITHHVPAVLAIFENCEMQTGLHTVLLKNFQVDRSILIALRKSLQNFNTIRTLKLENCDLTNINLRTLKTVLQLNETIVELNINGNPNKFQNFYILLKNTNLKFLSIKFCQINDRGIDLIAKQITTASDHPLVTLDVSSNFISDIGAESIANALRINRTLLSLNLADNWLTDKGCFTIMDVLQTFDLKHEEIVVRRSRIFEHLRKKAELVELYTQKFPQKLSLTSTHKSQSSNMFSRRSSKDSGNKIRDNASRSSRAHSVTSSSRKKDLTSTSKKSSVEIDLKLIMETIESEMKPDNHPFVINCYTDSYGIYCPGNLNLMSLNLSYNKITEEGVQKILQVLQYQLSVSHIQTGLSNITLEGNRFSEFSNEINEINYLINKSSSQRGSNVSNESRRNSKRKRSSGLSKISLVA